MYIVVGESDEYYNSQPSRQAYDQLHQLYRQEGLSEEEISELLVLDVKDAEYFESQGVTVQHGGRKSVLLRMERLWGGFLERQRLNLSF